MEIATATKDQLNVELERLSRRSTKLKVIVKKLEHAKEQHDTTIAQQRVQLQQLIDEMKINELHSEHLMSELECHQQELTTIYQAKTKIDAETKKRKKEKIREKVHQIFIKYVNDPNRSFDEERVIDRSIPEGKTNYCYDWKGVNIEYLSELTFRYDDYDIFFTTTVFVDGRLVAKIEY